MLIAIVENLDNVEEKYHDLYEERDGKFHLKRIDGLVTSADVTRVQSALNSEKAAHRDTKSKLIEFSSLGKVDELREKLDRFPELEEAARGKIDETKLNTLVDQRLRAKVAPIERERDQFKTRVSELESENIALKGEGRTRTVKDEVLKAASKLKVRSDAIEDVLLYAERLFDLEDGTNSVVAKDNVGITPGISAEVWLTEMQNKKPYWWGETQGGGASGSRAGGQSVVNPWKADTWNMTQQGLMVRQDPKKAEQLAKAAGTRIGGPKPSK